MQAAPLVPLAIEALAANLPVLRGESGLLSLDLSSVFSLLDQVSSSSAELTINNSSILDGIGLQLGVDLQASATAEPGPYVIFIERALDGALTTLTGVAEVINDAPVISQVSPVNASFGSSITILGQNFEPGAQVAFNGTVINSTVVVSDQEITVTVPEAGADDAIEEGAQDVEVENPDGQAATLIAAFVATDNEGEPGDEPGGDSGAGAPPSSSGGAPSGFGAAGAAPSGGGGGGGGGCDLAPGSSGDPLALLPFVLLLLGLAFLRR